ncbi:MAG TPA: recombinase family protein [Novosphingobium sp.]
MTAPQQRLRCAVYTRKSTEEGLDQQFNSLDAQREACEAYILSQTGEGWDCLPARYDDGGWSGGNMDRPALKRLLHDIAQRRVDVVVVYKVDRLTRSLMDFARIVESFDANNVSFVSVTQAFNTTSSMGRLTLNVLLSFAQFEREVTGERIRDKIAASKARGMWMGGNIPLGYDLGDRKLVVNAVEADQVELTFRQYLSLGSIPKVAKYLDQSGLTSKRWTARSGRTHGGTRLSCGAIAHILSNRVYVGEIVHKGKIHRGDHDAIVDHTVFEAVQAKLAENRHARVRRKTRAATCPLAGKLFDEDGQPMGPSFSYGRGRRTYCYYVSGSLLPNGRIGHTDNMKGRRISASRLERLLADRLAPIVQSGAQPSSIFDRISRISCSERTIRIAISINTIKDAGQCTDMLLGRAQLHLDPSARIEDGNLLLAIDAAGIRQGKAIRPSGDVLDRTEHSSILSELLRTSHRQLAKIYASPLSPASHPQMCTPINDWGRDRMAICLLAPDIQKALLLGAAPPGLEAEQLLRRDLPLDWEEQRRTLGFVNG